MIDPFFQAVFIFPSARVLAKWGTTGNLQYITDEQLYGHIINTTFRKKLSSEEVATLSQAFLALAHMERDFTERAAVAVQTRS